MHRVAGIWRVYWGQDSAGLQHNNAVQSKLEQMEKDGFGKDEVIVKATALTLNDLILPPRFLFLFPALLASLHSEDPQEPDILAMPQERFPNH